VRGTGAGSAGHGAGVGALEVGGVRCECGSGHLAGGRAAVPAGGLAVPPRAVPAPGCSFPPRWSPGRSRSAPAGPVRRGGGGDRPLLSTEGAEHRRDPLSPAALAIKALLATQRCREMSFLPDLGTFTMEKATLEFLEDIELKTLGSEQRTFKASELWEKNGAVIMAVRRPG
uniref:Uncharacterized protein n=1 Tax=Malurus cyaneus samueli TaxID=2593467 RepID=A0A8C5TFC4_9PASS